MQIQKVEEELGIQIFDRTKKPIELTDIGEKIVVQAKNIVVESNRIKDIVEQQKGFIGGEFRLGIIPTVSPTLLPMFLGNFIKKYPKVELIIEELSTEELLLQLKNGRLDAAIAATPLEDDKIKELVLYYEPFVAYVPDSNSLSKKTLLSESDLDIDDILLLEDGHCFRNGILNLCSPKELSKPKPFQFASGSFETLMRLSNEGLGTTLLPYLHTLDLNEKAKANIREFNEPQPSREVSLIFPKSGLKGHIIEALRTTINGVVRGAITFQNVKIISPLKK